MHYSNPQIVLTEVPDEISLALSISGCPLRCKGCHSTETYDPTYGKPLTTDALAKLIKKNKHITCILLYGGEWDMPNLITLLTFIKLQGLKICLYTGHPLNFFQKNILIFLDYIKVNPYKKELGGMASNTTNQRMYKLNNGEIEKELFLNKGLNNES
jgi:anaerobic ribonucleoside-triphosphate reductase activating protein